MKLSTYPKQKPQIRCVLCMFILQQFFVMLSKKKKKDLFSKWHLSEMKKTSNNLTSNLATLNNVIPSAVVF